MKELVVLFSLLNASSQPEHFELLLDREARSEVEFESLTQAQWQVIPYRNIRFFGEVGGVRASTSQHFVGFTRFSLKPLFDKADIEQNLDFDKLRMESISLRAKSRTPNVQYELLIHTPWTRAKSQILRRGVSLQTKFSPSQDLRPIRIDLTQLKVVSWGSELAFDPDEFLTGPIELIGVQVSRGSLGEEGRESSKLFPFDLELDSQVGVSWSKK